MPRVDMSALDAVDTMAVWTRGILLADAADYFAKHIFLAKDDEPRHSQSLTRIIDRNIAEHIERPDLKEAFVTVIDAVDAAAREFSSGLRARTQATEYVLQALRTGRLIAFGYLSPRNPALPPQQIPPDLFHSRHIENWRECWQKSVIRAADLEFVSVRVVRPNWIAKTSAPKQLPKPESVIEPRRRPGRPSSEDAIIKAIRSLFAEGKLPASNLRKENIALIRERVRALYPSLFPGDKGLADETIAKYLAEERARLQTHKL